MTDKRFMPQKVRRPREEVAQAAGQLEDIGLTVAGSWRREKDTVGDLDAIVPPDGNFRAIVHAAEGLFGYEEIRGGEMKSEGICTYKDKPLLLNFWNVREPKEWAALLLFATGPNDLNIMMRAKAKSQDKTLSQYGLFDVRTTIQIDNGRSEAAIFEALGMQPLTPVEREVWRDFLGGKSADMVEVQVPSSSGTGSYTVTLKNGRGWDCTCKGFAYRSSCRHLLEAEALHGT